jgi:hypothetical protein
MKHNLAKKAAVTILSLLFISFFGYFRTDLTTAFLGSFLFILCIAPVGLWLTKKTKHLPLYEAYSFLTFFQYWLPGGDEAGRIMNSPPELRQKILSILCLFLSVAAISYYTLLSHSPLVMRRSPFLNARLRLLSDVRFELLILFWLFVALSIFIDSPTATQRIPKDYYTIVRSVIASACALTLFSLSVAFGRNQLHTFFATAFFIGIGVLVTYDALSGFLISALTSFGVCILGYTLGTGRIPVVWCLVVLCFFSFLNLGKAEYRRLYWYEGKEAGPLTKLSDWYEASINELHSRQQGRKASQTIFERYDNTKVILTVVATTPGTLPFLNGKTYIDSLELFIPSFLYPNRKSVHQVMSEFGIRYGFLNHTQAKTTNIAIGAISEAWANGGWVCIVLVAAFIGCFCATGVLLTQDRQPDEIGFLLSVPFSLTIAAGLFDAMLFSGLMSFSHRVFGILGFVFLSSIVWGTTERSGSKSAERGAEPPRSGSPKTARPVMPEPAHPNLSSRKRR